MKGLSTLIKLHQRNLDALRREMVKIEEQKEQLIALVTKLQEDLIKEQEAAMSKPEMSAYLVGYAERVRERQLEISTEVAQLELQLQHISGRIAEEFGELKKFELTKEAQEKAEEELQNRREQQEMDEIGLRRYSRSEEE